MSEPCDKPVPGPMYWDWRCLNCDEPIRAHKPWWRRAYERLMDPQVHNTAMNTQSILFEVNRA